MSLHIESRGAHPRVVFVHGFAGDLHTWDELWAQPAAPWQALRYDLRGFGESIPKQSIPYTHANDLTTVLDAAHIEQCDLVGVSMGGAIALNFTLDHPERVRSLVLISPGMVGWEYSEDWQQRWSEIEAHARRGELDTARHLWWMHPLFDTIRTTAVGLSVHAAIQRYGGGQWIGEAHAPLHPDIERLHELETRTLLLSGEQDLIDYRLIADVIVGAAPNVQRVEMAGGHLLQLEEPETCARHIDAFIRQA